MQEILRTIDKLINLLVDENWHNAAELAEELKVQYSILVTILKFLNKYKFVDYRLDEEKVKIDPRVRQLVLQDEA